MTSPDVISLESAKSASSRLARPRPQEARKERGRLVVRWIAAATILSLLLSGATAQVRRADEDQVKAAYLYNFAKFVEWPLTSFNRTADPVIICAMGDERFAEILQQTARGKQAQGRPVAVKLVDTIDGLKLCHILMIAYRDKARIEPALRSAQSAGILTVGQSADFIRLGGIINLARSEDSVELEINPRAAEAAGLKISARLLAVSRVVAAPPEERGWH